MGRTVARWSRDPARKHQKYHQSGPARPATRGAQNGGDFVVVKRKMARTGRRALGSARRSQANSSPARCVRALRLNSMPRLHSLRREASSTSKADAFRAKLSLREMPPWHPLAISSACQAEPTSCRRSECGWAAGRPVAGARHAVRRRCGSGERSSIARQHRDFSRRGVWC